MLEHTKPFFVPPQATGSEYSSVSSPEPLYSPEVASFGHAAAPISIVSSKFPNQTAAYIVPINLPDRFCMNESLWGLRRPAESTVSPPWPRPYWAPSPCLTNRPPFSTLANLTTPA
ncbi:unnamed protein product [Protopolystoma xenopodis]|uniref:Uncharacterized protein n=1 Tax=Protopolystoma xenopodis TaxID=117903 RepID=A0A448XGB4_9PLAT|nr:unnamed protein product [Protopolystoma xenopodis]